MRISEVQNHNDKVSRIKRFIGWAVQRLDIVDLPRIRYGSDIDEVKDNRTFGSTNSDGEIWVHVGNRNVADCLRTLAHELVHHRQFQLGIAHDRMDDDTRQRIEDEANAEAGRMMRDYGKIDNTIYESTADTSCDDLRRRLLAAKKTDYDSIDTMMKSIAKKHHITADKLHDLWVRKYGITPDEWISDQNR